MLVYFSAENFRSIKEPIELNLRAAPRLRRLPKHVRMPADDKSLKVLKAAVLYGANASGKSNILKSIKFAQELITGYSIPNKPIKHDPFALTDDISADSSFYFEFIIAGVHFGFGVKFNQERILEESLYALSKGNEKSLYSRQHVNNEVYETKSDTIDTDPDITEDERKEFEFLIKYTPKNRLFITECEERGAFDKLKNTGVLIGFVHAFFKRYLVIIFPDSKNIGILEELTNKNQAPNDFIKLLQQFDTGIDEIESAPVDQSFFPQEFIEELHLRLERFGITLWPFTHENNEYYASLTDSGKIRINSLHSIHNLASGSKVQFDFNNESDGTLRLLDLLPLIQHESPDMMAHTFIIDEFDRSLHPNLAKSFLNLFLNSEYSENNNQLIVSTHEAELLDNKLLRRDEIWFVQKEWDASSRLYSLNDYSTRFDKDIHKAYLDGRFGAVPLIMDDFKK